MKQETMERLRVQPTRTSQQVKVDREKRIIYGASAAQAVEALGHNLILDQKSIEQIVILGNRKTSGVKVRYTHPGLSSDGMGKLLGRMKDFRVEGDKAIGDIHLSGAAFKSPDGNLGEYILDMAENDPDLFGMSVVIRADRVWVNAETGEETKAKPENATTDKPVARIKELYAVDAVDEPAANRDGMFSALWGTNQDAAAAFEDIDALLQHYGVSPERGYQFVLSYLEARGISPNQFTTQEQPAMNHEEEKDTQEQKPTQPAADTSAAWNRALAQSAAKQLINMSGLPTAFKFELNQAAERGEFAAPEEVDAAIEAKRQVLAKLQEDQTITGMNPSRASGMQTSQDKMQSGLDWMLGAGGETPAPNMRSIRDLYLAITGDYDFYGIFDPERSQLAAANTTTLPGMAANALNKAVAQHYQDMATWRWFENIVAVQAHDNSTQPIQMIMMDGVANLPTVDEGQAYNEATVGDSKEALTFSKKGRYVGITLEMIRRSDIARIQAIPQLLTTASIRARSAAIAGIFTTASGTGPTLADDNTVLFHSNHANISTVAFSPAEWAVQRKKMYSQTVPGTGNKFGMWPKFGLFPIDLYDTALETFGYGAAGTAVGKPNSAGTAQTANPYGESRMGDPRPIPLVVPEWTDANNWASIADPKLQPVIQMAYANAPEGGRHPMPEIFTVTGEGNGLIFTNDTLPVKIRDWWAYGVATYIGVCKSNVA